MTWNIKQLEDHLLIGSTLVEGSTLTDVEAKEILAGRTVIGHHVTEIRELLNYRSAIRWFAAQIDQSPFVSEELLLSFHRRLFDGMPGIHGRFKSHVNFTYQTDGSRHEYLKPERVGAAIAQWLTRFNETERGEASNCSAAELYYSFESIHPFEDGNGRIGRILIAYWLHWKHSLRFSFYAKDKVAHLSAIEAANHGDLSPLKGFFGERLSREEE